MSSSTTYGIEIFARSLLVHYVTGINVWLKDSCIRFQTKCEHLAPTTRSTTNAVKGTLTISSMPSVTMWLSCWLKVVLSNGYLNTDKLLQICSKPNRSKIDKETSVGMCQRIKWEQNFPPPSCARATGIVENFFSTQYWTVYCEHTKKVMDSKQLIC